MSFVPRDEYPDDYGVFQNFYTGVFTDHASSADGKVLPLFIADRDGEISEALLRAEAWEDTLSSLTGSIVRFPSGVVLTSATGFVTLTDTVQMALGTIADTRTNATNTGDVLPLSNASFNKGDLVALRLSSASPTELADLSVALRWSSRQG